ncbi:unnamed protein product [Arabis nemorensis]|uniref:Uncharacterized protein n=1 Tax=Arabis nemorensis TaxID=586526 RepID=A0A565CGD5_9BRAS|nr:unnamed protein product [Arabis nemorensis]
METRTTIKETKEAKESDAERKKKMMSIETSIFSSILADIEENPTILQNQKNLSEEVKFLGDGDDLKSEISIDDAKDFDEMLSTMLGDEDGEEGCGEIDEMIEEMLEQSEEDGSYLDRIKEGYVFGGLLETLLREKAEEEEKEISSWITNGEPESETRKLRQRDEKQRKRRVKAVRFGVEFSFLMAEYMFLRPNEVLADESEDYWMCLKRLGVDKDEKGMNVIIGKLEEVFEMVMRKKENNEHYNASLPDSIFRFEDYIRLCAAAIQGLGKIVWGLRKNQSEKLQLSDLDAMFEDCQKVLMKLELKLAEMKQSVYRSVSADYESFSKSERFDSLLRRKLMRRVNADNRFGRSMIGSYLVEIWKSLFQAEALHEQRKEA